MTQANGTLSQLPPGVRIRRASMRPDKTRLLTPGAIDFVVELARAFTPRLVELLQRRREVQARLDAGERFDFLPETLAVRDGAWRRGAHSPPTSSIAASRSPDPSTAR